MSHDFDPKGDVKGQMMYFLVNVTPPKQLNITTPNF